MARNVKEILDDGVRIRFVDGETLEVRMAELPPDIVKHLALFGLATKLGDSYAGIKDPEEARQAAAAVADRLRAGQWTKRPKGEPRTSDLALALAEVIGTTPEAAAERIAALDRAQRYALRRHPKVRAVLARIAADRAARRAEAAGASAADILTAIA